MLKPSPSRQKIHRVAIAGQVKDAITDQGISGARVKIIEAPNQLMTQVIFKAKLLNLQSLQMQYQKLKEFREVVENSDSKGEDKLQFIQDILEDATLTSLRKFQAVQAVIDQSSSIPDRKIAQLERTLTASDGWFYFVDLPAGLYHLEASLPSAGTRYSTTQSQIEITNEDHQDLVKLNSQFPLSDQFKMEFVLEPTTLLGKISPSDDHKQAISMAKVQIQGSQDYTLSLGELVKQQGKEWNYRLMGIEAGNTPQTVIVTAKGYIAEQKEISLQPGKRKSLDFELLPQ